VTINLYVEALFTDPVLAVMVKTALEDGLIDRASAELAWLAVVTQGLGNVCS
jgi:hypothetical protein